MAKSEQNSAAELADVTASARELITERHGRFIGAERLVMVTVQGGQNLARREIFDPHKHSAAERTTRRTILREYVIADSGISGRLPPPSQPVSAIWMIQNNHEPAQIGHRMSRSALERLRDRGCLASAGEAMLAQMIGDLVPATTGGGVSQ